MSKGIRGAGAALLFCLITISDIVSASDPGVRPESIDSIVSMPREQREQIEPRSDAPALTLHNFRTGESELIENPSEMSHEKAMDFVPRWQPGEQPNEHVRAIYDTYLDDGLDPFEAALRTQIEVYAVMEKAGLAEKGVLD